MTPDEARDKAEQLTNCECWDTEPAHHDDCVTHEVVAALLRADAEGYKRGVAISLRVLEELCAQKIDCKTLSWISATVVSLRTLKESHATE